MNRSDVARVARQLAGDHPPSLTVEHDDITGMNPRFVMLARQFVRMLANGEVLPRLRGLESVDELKALLVTDYFLRAYRGKNTRRRLRALVADTSIGPEALASLAALAHANGAHFRDVKKPELPSPDDVLFRVEAVAERLGSDPDDIYRRIAAGHARAVVCLTEREVSRLERGASTSQPSPGPTELGALERIVTNELPGVARTLERQMLTPGSLPSRFARGLSGAIRVGAPLVLALGIAVVAFSIGAALAGLGLLEAWRLMVAHGGSGWRLLLTLDWSGAAGRGLLVVALLAVPCVLVVAPLVAYLAALRLGAPMMVGLTPLVSRRAQEALGRVAFWVTLIIATPGAVATSAVLLEGAVRAGVWSIDWLIRQGAWVLAIPAGIVGGALGCLLLVLCVRLAMGGRAAAAAVAALLEGASLREAARAAGRELDWMLA